MRSFSLAIASRCCAANACDESAAKAVRRGPLPVRCSWQKRASSSTFDEYSNLTAAVIETVATWTDKDGFVDVAKMRKKFGLDPAERMVLHEFTHAVDESEAALRDRGSWSRRLEYLDQHVPAGKTDVWGKTHSLDPRIAASMVDRGYGVHGAELDAYELAAQNAVEVAKFPEPGKVGKPQFLVMDDGGERELVGEEGARVHHVRVRRLAGDRAHAREVRRLHPGAIGGARARRRAPPSTCRARRAAAGGR